MIWLVFRVTFVLCHAFRRDQLSHSSIMRWDMEAIDTNQVPDEKLTWPLVSVITTVRNAASTVELALLSYVLFVLVFFETSQHTRCLSQCPSSKLVYLITFYELLHLKDHAVFTGASSTVRIY